VNIRNKIKFSNLSHTDLQQKTIKSPKLQATHYANHLRTHNFNNSQCHSQEVENPNSSALTVTHPIIIPSRNHGSQTQKIPIPNISIRFQHISFQEQIECRQVQLEYSQEQTKHQQLAELSFICSEQQIEISNNHDEY